MKSLGRPGGGDHHGGCGVSRKSLGDQRDSCGLSEDSGYQQDSSIVSRKGPAG